MIPSLPTIRPLAPVSPGFYCRLFPADAGPLPTNEQLGCLALSMRLDYTLMPNPSFRRIPSGYTYFGQFIDHDLTYDISAVPDTVQDPTTIPNQRHTFLCLENLYGDGPGSAADGRLFEDDGLFFKLGAALGNGPSFDVPLDPTGRPMTADPRNSDNAIVRQVHAMFLQLHNRAVDELANSPVSAAERFAQARTRVEQQYQYVVFHDFLPRVCNGAVFAQVTSAPDSLIDGSDGFAIPVEFAQAAFRFGHSLVRSDYQLGVPENAERTLLRELFRGRHLLGALSPALAVNWDEFTAVRGNAELAEFIDTSIAEDLFRIPPEILATYNPPASIADAASLALPYRTLRRGAACQLPSGEAVQAVFPSAYGIKPVDRAAAAAGYRPWRALVDSGLTGRTPLWYHILLEAELNESGRSLGNLGSQIVAGTIVGALHSNPRSFLREHGSSWRPDPWVTPTGPVRISTLHDIARVTGLA